MHVKRWHRLKHASKAISAFAEEQHGDYLIPSARIRSLTRSFIRTCISELHPPPLQQCPDSCKLRVNAKRKHFAQLLNRASERSCKPAHMRGSSDQAICEVCADRACYKWRHLALEASQRARPCVNIQKENALGLRCVLLDSPPPPRLRCAPEKKGPGAAQTQYSELLYGFQGKAEQRGLNNTTTTKKKFFLLSSVSLSLS